MYFKIKFILTIIFILISFFQTGCSTDNNSEPNPSDTQTQTDDNSTDTDSYQTVSGSTDNNDSKPPDSAIDGQPNDDDSDICDVTPDAGNYILFFLEYQSQGKSELWKTDGTQSGTKMIKVFQIEITRTAPYFIKNIFGSTFFSITTEEYGRELWKTDGTTEGTCIVKDINPGNNSSISAFDFIEINETLFFFADNGINGYELWKSDGTLAGTEMVIDIAKGKPSSYARSLSVFNGTLIFVTNGGAYNSELWRSDGTKEGSFVIKGFESSPSTFTLFQGDIYFILDSRLWKSDGTEEGTAQVPLGIDNKKLNDSNITCVECHKEEYELYDNKIMLNVNNLIVTSNTLYFSSYHPEMRISYAPQYRYIIPPYIELYKFNVNKMEIKYVAKIVNGFDALSIEQLVYPKFYTVIGDSLYFFKTDINGYYNLFRSDGYSGTETCVGEIPITSGFLAVNDNLYFRSCDTDHGCELWIKNDFGISIVKDIQPGADSGIKSETIYGEPFYGSTDKIFIPLNNEIFFPANNGAEGVGLFKSDGTEEGTILVKRFSKYAADTIASSLTEKNGSLYFIACDMHNDCGLWKSDGTETGTILIEASIPVAENMEPAKFIVNQN